jgi:hypothetical protein
METLLGIIIWIAIIALINWLGFTFKQLVFFAVVGISVFVIKSISKDYRDNDEYPLAFKIVLCVIMIAILCFFILGPHALSVLFK